MAVNDGIIGGAEAAIAKIEVRNATEEVETVVVEGVIDIVEAGVPESNFGEKSVDISMNTFSRFEKMTEPES